jgi:hypothetical protein
MLEKVSEISLARVMQTYDESCNDSAPWHRSALKSRL